MSLFDELIGGLLEREGGYSNHISDSGGKTKFGITEGRARKSGWTGRMIDLPLDKAIAIYRADYWEKPAFAEIASIGGEEIAVKLFDMGVNIGVRRTSVFFQKILNGLNKQGELYPDLLTDSFIGRKTIDALRAYLAVREESVMVTGITCLQGEYYVHISSKYPKNEDFLYGWLKQRIIL